MGTEEAESSPGSKRKVLLEGTRLKGEKAREFYAKQLMLPEWMVDIPLYLKKDWYAQYSWKNQNIPTSLQQEQWSTSILYIPLILWQVQIGRSLIATKSNGVKRIRFWDSSAAENYTDVVYS